MNDISITPHLKLRETENSRFDDGNGFGLLALLKTSADVSTLSASESFFRRFARDCIARLCNAAEPDDRDLSKIFQFIRPDAASLSFLALDAPPMTGSEYLSGEFLSALLRDFETAVQEEFSTSSGPLTDYLRTLGPNWKHVGKVSFHLAENKGDATGTHPFAFMASFIHRLGDNDHPKHLPLAAALKAYADNRDALNALLSPIQSAAEHSALIRQLWETRTIFKPSAWTAAEAYRFLQDVPVFEEANIVVRIANLWKAAPPKASVSISLDVAKNSLMNAKALLDFSVSVTLDGARLTEPEIQQLLNSSGGLVRIREQWVVADPEKIAAVLANWREAQSLASANGISLARGLRLLAGADISGKESPADDDRETCQFEAGAELKKMLAELATPSGITLPTLSVKLTHTLRPYQFDGVKYLWRTTSLGMGACLADDMGLGKTLQLLTLITLWKSAGLLKALPVLLVMPATLLSNWRAESARFTPDLRITTLHPSCMDKEAMAALEKSPAKHLAGYDLALITYGMLTRMPQLEELDFPAVVADEAQAIKNPGSRQSRAVRKLKSQRRIAMTGTPVENRLSDLWSLFDFVNPGLLGSAKAFADFQKRLNSGDDPNANYAPLRRLTRPFILRRLKTDKSIISDLPDKTEVKAYCSLTKTQAALYAKAVDSLRQALEEPDAFKRRGIILGYLMRFKQICNHPAHYTGNGEFDADSSGKFLRLAELVDPIAARQEKLLVFTQFREMTEPIHEQLTRCFGRAGLILHGGTPVKKRAELVKTFQSDDGPPFFVLSLKAAGTGLNLTAASHVVHFDRWWNPAVENQASDRAYRIGQKRNVLIQKFICRGTLEEKIDAMIMDKQNLSDALLTEGSEKLLTSMSNDELMDFVKLDINTLDS